MIGGEARKEYYGTAPLPMAVQQSYPNSRHETPFVSRVNLQSQTNTPYQQLQKNIEVDDRFVTPVKVAKNDSEELKELPTTAIRDTPH